MGTHAEVSFLSATPAATLKNHSNTKKGRLLAPHPRQEARADGTTRIGIELAPGGTGTPANDRPPQTGCGNRDRTTGDDSRDASRARGEATSLHCTVSCYVETVSHCANSLAICRLSVSPASCNTPLVSQRRIRRSDVVTCHIASRPDVLTKKTASQEASFATQQKTPLYPHLEDAMSMLTTGPEKQRGPTKNPQPLTFNTPRLFPILP